MTFVVTTLPITTLTITTLSVNSISATALSTVVLNVAIAIVLITAYRGQHKINPEEKKIKEEQSCQPSYIYKLEIASSRKKMTSYRCLYHLML